MLLLRPHRHKYFFSHLDNTTYAQYMKTYSRAKCFGVRGLYGWATTTGCLDLVKNVVKGQVIQYGKEKLAVVLICVSAYVTSPVVCMVTNVTRVVQIVQKVHSICAFVYECFEDSSNLMFLPIDLALFGQAVPLGKNGRFDIIGNFSAILDD